MGILICVVSIHGTFVFYALKRFSRETVELPIVQILVLVARSLTEITTEDDRSGERFRVAAHCDVGQSVLSHCAETALK
jgi:hypothetical protein